MSWPASGPRVVFRVPVGSGYAAPVVSGGRLFLVGRVGDETVIEARDADDGSPLWTVREPATYVDDFDTYSDGPYATPDVFDETVYVVTGEGVLLALSEADGTERWRRNLATEYAAPRGGFPWGSSPLTGTDGAGRACVVVHVGGPGAGVVRLDPADGTAQWAALDDERSYASPRISRTPSGRSVTLVLARTRLVSLDLETGELLGETPFEVRGDPAARFNSVTPLVVGNNVYVTGGPGAGIVGSRLEPDGSLTEFFRQRRTMDSQYCNLTVGDGAIYGYKGKGQGGAPLRRINAADGSVDWSVSSVLDRGSSIGLRGRLLLLGENGHLASLPMRGPGKARARGKTDGPEFTSMTDAPVVPGPSFNAPALANGLLYVRGEGEVACFDLRR